MSTPRCRGLSIDEAADALVGGVWVIALTSSLPSFVHRIAARPTILSGLGLAIPVILIVGGWLYAAISVMRSRDWAIHALFSMSILMTLLWAIGQIHITLNPRSCLMIVAMTLSFVIGPLRVFGKLGPVPR